ncbi:hypothetical protein AB9F40_34885, partial [Rhizobium leguminosarum]
VAEAHRHDGDEAGISQHVDAGIGYHRQSEKRLTGRTQENDTNIPVVTSAGALIEGLKVMKAKKIAVVAHYMKPLTEL